MAHCKASTLLSAILKSGKSSARAGFEVSTIPVSDLCNNVLDFKFGFGFIVIKQAPCLMIPMFVDSRCLWSILARSHIHSSRSTRNQSSMPTGMYLSGTLLFKLQWQFNLEEVELLIKQLSPLGVDYIQILYEKLPNCDLGRC